MSGILLTIVGNTYSSLPRNTVVPSISGTVQIGNTLTSTTGTWVGADPITYSYQWQRNTSNISGATSSAYTIQGEDEGSTLRCVVTATNFLGSTSANSANTSVVGPLAPVNTAIPVISGGAAVGNTLTSSTGTWIGSIPITYTYQWQRNTSNISGATSSSYTVQVADEGSTLRCVVTATNSQGSTSANSANTPTVVQLPANTAVPVISGVAVEKGFTLTSSTGTWTGTAPISYTYRWQRNTSNISGATSSSYTLQAADVGNTVRCVVTATNTGGSVSANSASTTTVYSPPMAYGTAYQGGYFAGQISTSLDGVPTHNIVVAPASSGQTSGLQWKTSITNTAGTTSTVDGAANTAAMVTAGIADHPAAEFCHNLVAGGYSDWYLPARYELELCYFYLKPTTQANEGETNPAAVPQRIGSYTSTVPGQTSATDFRSGNSQAFFGDGPQNWTSTQASSLSAHVVGFYQGRQATQNKTYGTGGQVMYTRAIRRVAL